MKNLHKIALPFNEDQIAVIWFSIHNNRQVRNNDGVIEFYNHTFMNWSDTWFKGPNLAYIKSQWRASGKPQPDLKMLVK